MGCGSLNNNISRLGVRLTMQTHKLDPSLAECHGTMHSVTDSDESSSSDKSKPEQIKNSSRQVREPMADGIDSFDLRFDSEGSISSSLGSVYRAAEFPPRPQAYEQYLRRHCVYAVLCLQYLLECYLLGLERLRDLCQRITSRPEASTKSIPRP